MHNAAELDESQSSDKPSRNSNEVDATQSALLLAARFLDDVPKGKNIESSSAQTKMSEKTTATGANVKVDEHDLVRHLKRSDSTAIDLAYSDGANAKLQGFAETGADKYQINWKRQGEEEIYKAFSRDGKPIPNLGTISKVQFDTNGNQSFLDQQGQLRIIRGNGAVIFAGAGNFDMKFDNEGRITEIIPSAAAQTNGAPIRRFAGFKGQTEEFSKVELECPPKYPGMIYTHSFNEQSQKWECKDQNGVAYESPQGKRSLSKDGVYSYKDTFLVDGKPKELSRVSYPNGVEELQSSYDAPDGSPVTLYYSQSGDGQSAKFIGVQTFSPKRNAKGEIVKDDNGRSVPGLAGKKFLAGTMNDKPRIFETEPRTGTGIVWDMQGKDDKGIKFSGQVIFAGANSAYKTGQQLEPRYNLDFSQNGEVAYKDQSDATHKEYRDRSQSITFSDGTLLSTDEFGNTTRAGKDKQNCLEYIWKNAGVKGMELSRVNSVVGGARSEIWTNFGKEAVVQPDGRFSYEDKDGKLVFVDLDSAITKYLVGKDDKGPTLTPVEISLTNGARRVIEPGTDIEHPKRIVDTFIDANGRNMERALEALPISTPKRALASHNQRIQEYKLTEKVLGQGNFNQPGKAPNITIEATVTDLELLKNGDILCTAPVNAANPFQPLDGMRFEFKAKEMAQSVVPEDKVHPPKSMKPLDSDTRLLRAKERLEKIFTQEIAGRLSAKPDGKPKSMDEFISEDLLLPQPNSPGNEANAQSLASQKNAQAYRCELAMAIVSQQKIDSAARKKMIK